jgi:hypothetical protein
LGTSEGIGGLCQAFKVLKCKGLISQSTKGPFWHHLDEALHHISEAHFRASWLDVGGVKNLLLPTILFRFAGGGNPKYTIKILELFQGLKREWPESCGKWSVTLSTFLVFDLGWLGRYYITEFCWLMTRTGTVDSWLAFDLGQEENICDIKVSLTQFSLTYV